MQKTVIAACVLTTLVRCSLMAQGFAFSTVSIPSEKIHQELAAEISIPIATPTDKISPSDLDTRFRSISEKCTEDVLVFADGKTLCGRLFDMPPLKSDEGSSPIDISDISAVIFDSDNNSSNVHYVLRSGPSVLNKLAPESFRFSVEYLEDGGEQRVQVFYISPRDIRYIIVSPRIPKSPAGIQTSGLKKTTAYNKARENAVMAANGYDPKAHMLLAEAGAAFMVPSHAIESLNDSNFTQKEIISYYAELGNTNSAHVSDAYELAFENKQGETPSSNVGKKGLIYQPKALFSTTETFDSFHELAFEDVQNENPNSDSNMLATAQAELLANALSGDDHLFYQMFAANLKANRDDDEDADDGEDLGLSGIQFVTDNLDKNDKDSDFAIAFSTDTTHWVQHNYQCGDRDEASEWPPVKQEACSDVGVDDLPRGKNSNASGKELVQIVLADIMDKMHDNEMVAIESLLLDTPENPSTASRSHQMILSGHSVYIASYPVTNQQYLRFVEATHHQPPAHWKNGHFALTDAHMPVVNVSYEDAIAYVEWAKERLPSYKELARVSNSLGQVDPEFKEWTSTPSKADSEAVKLYQRNRKELLLQDTKMVSPTIGFRSAKE